MLLFNGKVADNGDDRGGEEEVADEKAGGAGEGEEEVVKLVNGGRDDMGGSIWFDGMDEEGDSRREEGFKDTGSKANDRSILIGSKNKVSIANKRIKEYLIKR